MESLIVECILTANDYDYVAAINQLSIYDKSIIDMTFRVFISLFLGVGMLAIMMLVRNAERRFGQRMTAMSYAVKSLIVAGFGLAIYINFIAIPATKAEVLNTKSALSKLNKPDIDIVAQCADEKIAFIERKKNIELTRSETVEVSSVSQKLKYGSEKPILD